MFSAVEPFEFDAELWLYEGDTGWHFITVPPDISDQIEAATADSRQGFGSVPVRVTVGVTTWSTSVFPDAKRQAYLLPMKKEVRRRESLSAGDRVSVVLTVAGDRLH